MFGQGEKTPLFVCLSVYIKSHLGADPDRYPFDRCTHIQLSICFHTTTVKTASIARDYIPSHVGTRLASLYSLLCLFIRYTCIWCKNRLAALCISNCLVSRCVLHHNIFIGDH